MGRKKRTPLGAGVIGRGVVRDPVKWGFTGKQGTKYTALWKDEKVRLEANGSFIGEVPLREGATESEARQVTAFYFSNFSKRELGGVKPRIS